VAAAAAPRAGRPDVRVAVDLPTRAGAVVVSLPAVAAAAPVPAPPVVAAGTRAPRAAPRQRPGAARARPTADSPDAPAAAATELASLARRAADRGHRPGPDHAVADRVTPRARPAGPTGNLGPGRQAAPPALAHRSFQQRRRLLDEMGGSNESEAGVSRALVYLAKNQEPDGRWTYVEDRRPRRSRDTDMALTGLSTLCFLAADHTPARPGPYRQSVARAMDYLLAQQKPDGDLRGRGRMYCHAIATLAIAEAAIMTGDERYRDAAVKGAKFIIKAQNRRTGGWRYSPGDTGDTSVVGWQVMALRSVERLGYKIPDSCRKGAFRWLDSVGAGKQRMLAGYTGRAPKPAMVAEAMFSRILLGQQLTEAQQKEACDYLLKHMPDRGRPHYYYWYYASLAMAQLRNDAWTKWNARMRDHLIKLQRKSGRLDGSWDTRSAYGARAGSGRVYTTAMATLTLEVYYRYLPMYGGKGPGAVDPAPAPPSKD